jgi:hypothetical protein
MESGGGKSSATICEMCAQGLNGDYDPETSWANARLIAAAPAMLAALKLGEPSSGCLCGDCVAARKARSQAIALAEGRTL